MLNKCLWIDGSSPGRMAVVPRPRGGDWLGNEVAWWRREGIDIIVSLLTPEEQLEFDLVAEPNECRAHGIDYVSFPIRDRGVPESRESLAHLVHNMAAALSMGKSVGLHCRAGIGRSAVVAACVLVGLGHAPATAVERIATARGCPVPETTEQREWIGRFAQFVAPHIQPV